MTARDLITDAAMELQVIGQAEPVLDAYSAAFLLGKLNRLIDNWNAEREAIYADQFLVNTLTPGLQPHTLGPTGATWTTAIRPVSIEGATLVVGTINYPMRIRQAAWWEAQTIPTLSTTIPTDLYYNPTWPNGSLYFWPKPSAGYQVQLLVRGLLATVDYSTTITMPPGYRDALTLTLAESAVSGFAVPPTLIPMLAMQAAKARARIFTNNLLTPPLATRDVGLPGSRSWFDWRSGLVR